METEESPKLVTTQDISLTSEIFASNFEYAFPSFENFETGTYYVELSLINSAVRIWNYTDGI
jgi:hypothetical protein